MFEKGRKPPDMRGKWVRRKFPKDGTAEERYAFFRDEFLALARRSSNIAVKEKLLTKAMQADKKALGETEGKGERGAEDERAQYEEFKRKRDGET